MTNQELLQQVHIYINETNFFHSKVVDSIKRHKLEKILNIKKKICTISSLHSSRYPLNILLIKHDLQDVLPYRKYPIHYQYSQRLQTIFDNCRQKIKEIKVTI